ncbi:hypothetical protein TNIN_42111 [Trichonephila inaurata madagascariensis]|uniref:Uncharacterized protein n=1 Tax=Trichonephila inaurata madagascariensis TaxID=2747483 RepID=A0A8X7C2D7_9ARAC|nr:hypothetical protein TNIN_42111 [Trichonephila inaurata madagascariensis]
MNTFTFPHLVSLFQLRQLLLTTSRETANQCPSSLLFEKNELWTQLAPTLSMTVESLRVKQRSLWSSFTMCCTSIEEALKKDISLTDLFAFKKQITDKFTSLDIMQEHVSER